MPIPLSLNVRNCVDFINLFFISVAKMLPIKWNKRPRSDGDLHEVRSRMLAERANEVGRQFLTLVLNVEKRITHTVR